MRDRSLHRVASVVGPARGLLLASALTATLLAPGSARAAEPPPAEDPWARLDAPDDAPPPPSREPPAPAPSRSESEYRPIRLLAVEVNPLAALIGRFGGQIGVGLAGPFSLIGGASTVGLGGEDQLCSSYDSGASESYGRPAARGWSTELGGRAYLAVKRRHRATDGRIDLFLAGSWVHEHLTQDVILDACALPASTTSPRETIRRDGAAVDVGGQATLANGIYVLAGFGYLWMLSERGVLSTRPGESSMVGNPTDAVQRGRQWPRLLLSIGWTR
jgi:hypothetical protein